ncbi:MAG TPA: adenylate/guanylate cyclase domain-containing protein [Acidobacteriaceae bacterium]
MTVDRKAQREFAVGVCVAVALSAVGMLLLAHSRGGRWLESGMLDTQAQFAASPAQADPRIVIIDADNASLETLQDKLGRWPWTRRVWTEVVRYVTQGQPKAVAIDAIFSGAESDAVDSDFADVLKQNGNTVLGFTFVPTHMEESGNDEAEKLSALQEHQAGQGQFGSVVDAAQFFPNLPEPVLANAAAGLGALNALPDPDGVIRRVGVQFRYAGKTYDSLDLRTVELAEKKTMSWQDRRGLLGGHFVEVGGRSVPVDAQGRMLLDWHGGSTVYPRLPLWQVICSIYPDQCPAGVQKFPPDYFRGKIVLIGASATASYDAHPTPFATAAPGFIAHATAVDNLLNGVAIREAPEWMLTLLVVSMAIAGGVMLFRLRNLAGATLLLIAVMAAYVGVAFWVYDKAYFALPIVTPCLALVLSFGASTAARYITTGRQLRQTRGMLNRYMSPQLVEYVMSNIGSLSLNGDKRELTILVSDVRNFTTMTERSEPLKLIALLDDYFSAMTEIIFRHNGIVDKFIGDGILAYWGAFTPEVNHAAEAAQAALEMLARVEELNTEWTKQGRETIAIGVGLNTGPVIFGNIGRGKKIEFTVIGDAVNLASRLEGLNKEFKTSIIVSECTRERIAGQATTRALGGYKVKGKTVETTVHELQSWNALDA